jgi:hypothetical protein
MSSHPVIPNPLFETLRQIILDARKGAYQAVNHAMVGAYWDIGRLIVEEEQGGQIRAGYGTFLLKDLAARMTEEFGSGFSLANLKNFRRFFLVFPKGLHEGNIPADEKGYTVCSELSWSHYRLLMRVKEPCCPGILYRRINKPELERPCP